jgi:hypothetical protein
MPSWTISSIDVPSESSTAVNALTIGRFLFTAASWSKHDTFSFLEFWVEIISHTFPKTQVSAAPSKTLMWYFYLQKVNSYIYHVGNYLCYMLHEHYGLMSNIHILNLHLFHKYLSFLALHQEIHQQTIGLILIMLDCFLPFCYIFHSYILIWYVRTITFIITGYIYRFT